MGKRIDKGAFSLVTIVKGITPETEGLTRALKTTVLKQHDEKAKEALSREIALLKQCNHENIIALYEHYQHANKMWMVLDLCAGGSLFSQIGNFANFSERVASKIIYQIASGLEYMHSKNIIHRDIKPENIMFCSDVKENFDNVMVKIIDFGLAVQSEEPLKMSCGTPSYIAPEIASGTPYHVKVDVWALGIVLYKLLSGGIAPFRGANRDKKILFANIRKAPVEFPDDRWAQVSDESQDLILKMLTKRAKHRISSEDILTHPWITGNSSDSILGFEFQDTFRRNLTMEKLRKGVRAVMTLNKLVSVWEEENQNGRRELAVSESLDIPQKQSSNASTPDTLAIPPASTPEGSTVEAAPLSISKSRNGSMEDAVTPSSSFPVHVQQV